MKLENICCNFILVCKIIGLSLTVSITDMEDEHVHKLCLNDEKDTHFFAVFDGHGGQVSAQYAAKHLDNCILSHNAYRKYFSL